MVGWLVIGHILEFKNWLDIVNTTFRIVPNVSSSRYELLVWLFEFKMKTQGAWIISRRNIVLPPYQTGWEWTKTPESTKCNKKISKKCWASMKDHEFWSPASTFQWRFYGGNYIGIFWGSSIGLGRADGELTFTRLPRASTRYYALFRLLRASVVQKV
jgi:hypothetical protein